MIKNSGEVYSREDLPDSAEMSPEEWAARLTEQIDPSILGQQGIQATNLSEKYGVKTTEGVIIDVSVPRSEQPSRHAQEAVALINLNAVLDRH